jgi:hypothetical protein
MVSLVNFIPIILNKTMKILLLICVIVTLLLSGKPAVKEKPKEEYIIGRFTVIKDPQGYQAYTKDTISLHYPTMAKSIKAIQ